MKSQILNLPAEASARRRVLNSAPSSVAWGLANGLLTLPKSQPPTRSTASGWRKLTAAALPSHTFGHAAVPIPEIIQAVADHYNLRPGEITGHSRLSRYIEPRSIAIFLAFDLNGDTLTREQIAAAFHREVSAVDFGRRKIASDLESLRPTITKILSSLSAPSFASFPSVKNPASIS